MHRLLIPLWILLGAAAGAAGHFAASRWHPAPEPAGATRPAAGRPDLEAIRRALGEVQTRLARLESKRAFEDVLNDPELRSQLATALREVTAPDPEGRSPVRRGSPAWRRAATSRLREGCQRTLEALRRELGADDAKWKVLAAILKEHFKPLDAALAEFEKKGGERLPRVNEILAPGIPATVARLRGAMAPDEFRAFDRWRRDAEGTWTWGVSPGACLLAGKDYQDYRVKRSAALSWKMVGGELFGSRGIGKLEEKPRARLEQLVREHLRKVYRSAGRSGGLDLRSRGAVARLRSLTRALEVAIGHQVSPETAKAFARWKVKPGNRSCYFFGESYRPSRDSRPKAGSRPKGGGVQKF